MREVIDFNKNFLTGEVTEVTEVKKYKEDTMYRGTATIQVFDKEGTIIQEAKSTNFIHPGLSSYLYNLYFKNMLLHGSETYQSINKLRPASYMILTSNTKAENPNNYQIEGDLIGYSSGWGTYSGDSTTQGSLNTAETSYGDWNRHVVIDFPTHACNGTFQSIYWTSAGTTTSGVCINDVVYNDYPSSGPMAIFKNKIYAIKGNDTKNIFIIDKTTGELIEEKTLTFNVTDITASDTHLYIIDTSGKNIYKMDEMFNVVQTIAFNKTIYNPSTAIFLRIIYSNEGLVVLYMPSSGTFAAAVLDINTGSIKKELNFGSILRNYFVHTLLYNDYIIMTKTTNSNDIQNIAYYYNIKENKLINFGFDNNFLYMPHEKYTGSGAPYFSNSTVDRSTNEVYVTCSKSYYGNDGYRILKGSFIPYFSHTLLPAPITKTSANTMKIQYDFVVEPRGAFQI